MRKWLAIFLLWPVMLLAELPDIYKATPEIWHVYLKQLVVDNFQENIEVLILPSSDMNAYANESGIKLTVPMLAEIRNEDELLGVLAHEVAHLKKGHTKAIKVLYPCLTIAEMGRILQILPEGNTEPKPVFKLDEDKYLRQETEADDYALDFLAASGRNICAYPDLFLRTPIEIEPDIERAKRMVNRCLAERRE